MTSNKVTSAYLRPGLPLNVAKKIAPECPPSQDFSQLTRKFEVSSGSKASFHARARHFRCSFIFGHTGVRRCGRHRALALRQIAAVQKRQNAPCNSVVIARTDNRHPQKPELQPLPDHSDKARNVRATGGAQLGHELVQEVTAAGVGQRQFGDQMEFFVGKAKHSDLPFRLGVAHGRTRRIRRNYRAIRREAAIWLRDVTPFTGGRSDECPAASRALAQYVAA